MGLIKAAQNAGGNILGEQWKEYFYCDSLDQSTIMKKGVKKTTSGSNTNGEDNIISKGSVIAVADGQCMIIVEQGKVVEICAEPGEFTFDSSTEPTIFAGNLGESIIDSLKNFGKRFTFGGEAPKDQRVYYFNTKELIGNKYGTPNPVPFTFFEPRLNYEATVGISCFGEYSYRVCDPILFYTNICGNAASIYKRETLDGQLKTEFLTALQQAFGKISEQGIKYSAITAHTMELADAMNEVLSKKWRELRGIEVVSVGVSSLKASEEDEERLKNLQEEAALKDPELLRARIGRGSIEAMNTAAANPNGAMGAFMGMGMMQGMGANMMAGLGTPQQTTAQPVQQAAPAAAGVVAGAAVQGWTCQCGQLNQGKFCQNCGTPKPAGVPQYKCDKCGWMPEDPTNPPKFCPECGDPFGDEDIVK